MHKENPTKVEASSECQNTDELGPEYNLVKTLLKKCSKKYTIGPNGNLLRILVSSGVDNTGTRVNLAKFENLCDFVPWPVCEIIKDNRGTKEIHVKLEGLLPGGRPLEPLIVSMKEFESMGWVLKGWGIEARIEPHQGEHGATPKELVRDAIQCMAGNNLPHVVE